MQNLGSLRTRTAVVLLLAINALVFTLLWRAQPAGLAAMQGGHAAPDDGSVDWTPGPPVRLKQFPPGSITFNKDIASIIYQNCSGCHRPGESGKTPLTSYSEVRKHARDIASATLERYMPPWKPEPGYGDFVDGQRLTDDQISALQQWAREGAPLGEGPEPPRPRPLWTKWRAGVPDQILTMSQAFTVQASGKVAYRAFVIPVRNPQTIYVSGVECLPDNREMVHHVDILADSDEEALRKQAASGGVGYPSFGGSGVVPDAFVGGYLPGFMPMMSPPDMGFELKPHTNLILVAHFTPTGKPEPVRMAVGLYKRKTVPRRKQFSVGFDTHKIDIPPGARNFSLKFSGTVPYTADLISIGPHAHYRGREMRVQATPPGGKPFPLVWLRDWDFDFQRAYTYRRPVRLPRGTRLDMEYIYDNSADNPRNPHQPPRRVRWGEATVDEMADLHLQLSPVTPLDEALLRQSFLLGQKAELEAGYHGEKGDFQNKD